MNRKQRRQHIAPFILHSKALDKKSVKEEVLDDGSIKFTLEGYASTTAKDGSGDIVMPEGIDLSRFKQNPIMKIGHKRGEENNIGMFTDLQVRKNGLYVKGYAILSPEIEDHKKIIHGLRHGLIKGFSIGFGNVKNRYDADRQANIIESLELYEISLVDIPDNPLTVTKALEAYRKRAGEEMEVKGPACRMQGETTAQCTSRKISELLDEGMTRDQAVATAINMCSEMCDNANTMEDDEDNMENEAMPTVVVDEELQTNQVTGPAAALSEFTVVNYKLLGSETMRTGVIVDISAEGSYSIRGVMVKGTPEDPIINIWRHESVGDQLIRTEVYDVALFSGFASIATMEGMVAPDVTGAKFIKKDLDNLDEVYAKYNEVTNMSASDLKAWKETECSWLAGLSKAPIDRNIRLKEKNKDQWTERDVRDANRTISFIARMTPNLGGENVITDSNGKECGTKAFISLKNWAFDANKKSVADVETDNGDAKQDLPTNDDTMEKKDLSPEETTVEETTATEEVVETTEATEEVEVEAKEETQEEAPAEEVEEKSMEEETTTDAEDMAWNDGQEEVAEEATEVTEEAEQAQPETKSLETTTKSVSAAEFEEFKTEVMGLMSEALDTLVRTGKRAAQTEQNLKSLVSKLKGEVTDAPMAFEAEPEVKKGRMYKKLEAAKASLSNKRPY